MQQIIQSPSPNFNDRDPSAPLRYIVLHYTGMKSAEAALERLRDPKSEVSAHYLVDEDGKIYKLVDENKRAWHAGKSSWRGTTDINSASIGVELVNPGHQFGYRAFPAAQIAALTELLRDIMSRNKLSARNSILAHADIAPGRKEDPGELFPWEQLAQNGIGCWPDVQPSDYVFAEDDEVQKLLRAIGYDCPETGAYDRGTRAALIAFQRHYEPENLTGTPEKETVARLRALARLA